MLTFNYTYPVTYISQNVFTRNHPAKFKVINCGYNTENTLDDLFCNNACENDSYYCQPFIIKDKLYFQWSFFLPYNEAGVPDSGFVLGTSQQGYITPTLVDLDGNTIIANISPYCTQYGVGFDSMGNPYQYLVFDTSKLEESCFILKLAYNLGTTENPEMKYIYSEPYCLVKCNEPTVLIEGEYTCKDENGAMYSDFTLWIQSQNGYKCQVRVPATIEAISHSISKTKSGNSVISVDKSKNYLLRTNKVPEYVADKIAVALGGKRVFIDGIEYDVSEGFSKDFEDGSMWIVTVQLSRISDTIKMECKNC